MSELGKHMIKKTYEYARGLWSVNKTADEKEYKNIISKLPTRSSIFLPTDKISRDAQLAGVRKVKDIYERRLDEVYRPRLRELREKCKEYERCFVIGNGPSLNYTDLSVLKDEVTFAVNGFFLKTFELDWLPTYYVVEDHLVAEDRREWINAFEGPMKLFPVYLAYCLNEADDTIFFNHQPRKSFPHGFDFSTDAADITYTGCTVTFTCLQLAYYLGFKEIYLIGVDAEYDVPKDVEQNKSYGVGVLDMKSDDSNHFHPDYFGKGFRWHDPQVDKMLGAYQEARRVADLSGRRIYNATVGGKLEVFERKSFTNLFPHAKTPKEMTQEIDCVEKSETVAEEIKELAETAPRLLLIDHTRIGDGTATGELKASLFRDWPENRLLQIFQSYGDIAVSYRGNIEYLDKDNIDLFAKIHAFAPEIVLYRPVPGAATFHDIAMALVHRFAPPLVTWIMDDWPARLEAEDPEQFCRLNADWHELLAAAVYRFSISEFMSAAFEKRYALEFKCFANGVDPNEWPRPRTRPPRSFRVRYAGSLAKNMTLDSVARIAQAIDILAQEGYDIVLEIKTRPVWYQLAKAAFKEYYHVSFITDEMAQKDYREWLSEADVVIIAYNFDPASVRYIKYSIANKLPECLASGAVVLGHGPRGVATIDYLEESGCAIMVTEPNAHSLSSEIKALIHSPFKRLELATEAQQIAFKNHKLSDIRRSFMEMIIKASQKDGEPVGFSRAMRAHVDETAAVANLLNDRKGPDYVMLDVGAHFGAAAKHFHKLGWSIYCFEPDIANRSKLEMMFGNISGVTIDPRAVSDQPATDKSFFTSDESTGISGLHAFRDTHRETAKVDVTTVSEIIDESKLDRIDFLKIDVEGLDLNVLKGVPWDLLRPEVIECEFEDAKTIPLGHTYRDIADYLIEHGYSVYLSEWHPIIHYGVRHQWRRLIRYPKNQVSPNSWGNIVAFINDPGLDAVQSAIYSCLSPSVKTVTSSSGNVTNITNPSRNRVASLSTRLAIWAQSHSPLLLSVGRYVKHRTHLMRNKFN